MITKFLLFMTTLGTLSMSCTTSTERPEFEESRIIERMEGFDETPAFATGSQVMWVEGQEAYFANILLMSGDSRPDACMNAASLSAKVEMLKYIRESLTTSGQLNSSSAISDAHYESLSAFISNGNLSGATVKSRYFDRREISDELGERKLKVRCAALVSINKSILERQLKNALSHSGGHPAIRDQLLESQRSFIESL